jgi:hypothetical protein
MRLLNSTLFVVSLVLVLNPAISASNSGPNENLDLLGSGASNALWHFNDSGNDLSGNSYDLSVQDASFTGRAVSIDDNSVLERDNVDNGEMIFDGESNTIEFWVKPDWKPGDDKVHTFFRLDDDGAGCYKFAFIKRGDDVASHRNELQWGLTDGCDNTQSTFADIPDSIDWKGNWHHVAGVFDEGNNLSLYLNGELLASYEDPYMGSPGSSDGFDVLSIGNWKPTGGWSSSYGDQDWMTENEFNSDSLRMNGKIASVRITNRALDPDEFGVNTDLPICDFRGPLNECIANTSHNISGQEYNVSSVFEVRENAIFEALNQKAVLEISNSSSLSGLWSGIFDIVTEKPPVIVPGAEFRPRNGDIVIGK